MRLREFLRGHYRENPNGYLFANEWEFRIRLVRSRSTVCGQRSTS